MSHPGNDAINDLVSDLFEEYLENLESFTKEQLKDTIVGIIKSGDLVRYSCPDKTIVDYENNTVTFNERSGMSYMPYRKQLDDQWGIMNLENKVNQLNDLVHYALDELDKIRDSRKRHKESDKNTEVYCIQNIADVAYQHIVDKLRETDNIL